MAISAEGREFLHAVRNDDVDAAKLIFRLHGQRLLEPHGGGALALRAAAKLGSMRMVTFLLAAGIPASLADADGRTPSDSARTAGHEQLASLLDAALSPRQPPPKSADRGAAASIGGESDHASCLFSGGAAEAHLSLRPPSARGAPLRSSPTQAMRSPASYAPDSRVSGGASSARSQRSSPRKGDIVALSSHEQQVVRQEQRDRLVAHTQRAMELELARLRAATDEFRRLRNAIGAGSAAGGAGAAYGHGHAAAGHAGTGVSGPGGAAARDSMRTPDGWTRAGGAAGRGGAAAVAQADAGRSFASGSSCSSARAPAAFSTRAGHPKDAAHTALQGGAEQRMQAAAAAARGVAAAPRGSASANRGSCGSAERGGQRGQGEKQHNSIAAELRSLRAQTDRLASGQWQARAASRSAGDEQRPSRLGELQPAPLPGPAQACGSAQPPAPAAQAQQQRVAQAAVRECVVEPAPPVASPAPLEASAMASSNGSLGRCMQASADSATASASAALAAMRSVPLPAAAAVSSAQRPAQPRRPATADQPSTVATATATATASSSSSLHPTSAPAKRERPVSARAPTRAGRLAESILSHGGVVPIGVSSAALAEQAASSASAAQRSAAAALALALGRAAGSDDGPVSSDDSESGKGGYRESGGSAGGVLAEEGESDGGGAQRGLESRVAASVRRGLGRAYAQASTLQAPPVPPPSASGLSRLGSSADSAGSERETAHARVHSTASSLSGGPIQRFDPSRSLDDGRGGNEEEGAEAEAEDEDAFEPINLAALTGGAAASRLAADGRAAANHNAAAHAGRHLVNPWLLPMDRSVPSSSGAEPVSESELADSRDFDVGLDLDATGAEPTADALAWAPEPRLSGARSSATNDRATSHSEPERAAAAGAAAGSDDEDQPADELAGPALGPVPGRRVEGAAATQPQPLLPQSFGCSASSAPHSSTQRGRNSSAQSSAEADVFRAAARARRGDGAPEHAIASPVVRIVPDERRKPTQQQLAVGAAIAAQPGTDEQGAAPTPSAGLSSSTMSVARTGLADTTPRSQRGDAAHVEGETLGFTKPALQQEQERGQTPNLLDLLLLAPAQRRLLESSRVPDDSPELLLLGLSLDPRSEVARGDLAELAAAAAHGQGVPSAAGTVAQRSSLWPHTICLRAERTLVPHTSSADAASAAAAAAAAVAAGAMPPAQLMLQAAAGRPSSADRPLRLGRAADCALRLADERVSSTHFTVQRAAVALTSAGAEAGAAGSEGEEPEGWRWAVRDEGSSNGSLLCLSGLEAPPAPVSVGDQLILGNSRLIVSLESQSEPADRDALAADGSSMAAAAAAAAGQSAQTLVLSLLATEDWGALRWAIDVAASGGVITIGRASHNTVVLPDRSVSSEHAVLLWKVPEASVAPPEPSSAGAGAWWVRDRGSSNGTYVRLCVPRQRSRLFALTPGHKLCAGSCSIAIGRFASGVASVCGRRPSMEDAHCIIDNLPLTAADPAADWSAAGPAQTRPPAIAHGDDGWRASLFGVYDGHSGGRAAAFLKAHLHGAISQQLRAAAGLDSAAAYRSARSTSPPQELTLSTQRAREALERAFLQTDAALLARAADGDAGSCAAVALVTPTHVLTAHVGDCRVVLWRNGVAVPLTFDHRASAPTERARVEAQGGFVAYGRVLGQLAVSRSFGDRAFKQLDISGGGGAEARIMQLVSVTPDVACVRWEAGDFLLLACDGVWDVMTDQEALDTLINAYRSHGNMQLAAEQLVHSVEHDRRSTDNITAIGVVLQ